LGRGERHPCVLIKREKSPFKPEKKGNICYLLWKTREKAVNKTKKRKRGEEGVFFFGIPRKVKKRK